MTPEQYAAAVDLERRRGLAFVHIAGMLAHWSLGMHSDGRVMVLESEEPPIYRDVRRRARAARARGGAR